MNGNGCPHYRSGSALTRRKFLAVSGAGVVGTVMASGAISTARGTGENPFAPPSIPPPPKARVGLIFSHITPEKPTWPCIGYDYEGRKEELTAKLKQACPQTEFVVRTAMSVEEAQNLVGQLTDVDGFVSYIVGIWTGVPNVIVHAGKPVVLVDDLFAGSGEFIGVYARSVREGLPVVGVASSDFEDVAKAVRLFEVRKGIGNAKLLVVRGRDISEAARLVAEATGIEVVPISSHELNAYYQKADPDEAAELADHWIREARRVVEPTREEIVKSAKIYLGVRSLMQDRTAEAITIDCLGLIYSDRLPAYPCLSHRQLNDSGYVGACEADINSSVTMIMMRHLAHRPGFISDPVFDFARSRIIYAHCVAPTRVFGPQGRSNPFIIRSHAEYKRGAVVQSFLPLGENVTTIEANVREKALVVHSGKTVEDVDTGEKACRTKLAAEASVEKILTGWRWGWHRVTFYGDWRKDVKNLATLMGLQVYDEDV